MKEIIAMLDEIADKVQAKGFTKEAEELDVISNTLEAGFMGDTISMLKDPKIWIIVSTLLTAGIGIPQGAERSFENWTEQQRNEYIKKNKPLIQKALDNNNKVPAEAKPAERVEITRTHGGGRHSPQSA